MTQFLCQYNTSFFTVYFTRDFKPHYTLTSCWYRLSRINGKLVILDVGFKAYEAYLRKIGM